MHLLATTDSLLQNARLGIGDTADVPLQVIREVRVPEGRRRSPQVLGRQRDGIAASLSIGSGGCWLDGDGAQLVGERGEGGLGVDRGLVAGADGGDGGEGGSGVGGLFDLEWSLGRGEGEEDEEGGDETHGG